MNTQPPNISFKWTLAALACAFATPFCACTPSSGRLHQWGTMQSVLHDGKTEARVDLTDLARHPHCYAIGALAGLDGEVVVIDGAPWVTRSDGVTATTTQALPEHNEAATLLTAAYVPDWGTITVNRDLSLRDLERHLAGMAREYGLRLSRGVPFLVEGYFDALSYHVIRGSCPMQSQREGRPAASPFRAKVDRERGMLVGFLVAGAEGRITHHGQTMHIHVFFPGKTPVAGHVDDVRIAAGAMIRVPSH